MVMYFIPSFSAPARHLEDAVLAVRVRACGSGRARGRPRGRRGPPAASPARAASTSPASSRISGGMYGQARGAGTGPPRWRGAARRPAFERPSSSRPQAAALRHHGQLRAVGGRSRRAMERGGEARAAARPPRLTVIPAAMRTVAAAVVLLEDVRDQRRTPARARGRPRACFDADHDLDARPPSRTGGAARPRPPRTSTADPRAQVLEDALRLARGLVEQRLLAALGEPADGGQDLRLPSSRRSRSPPRSRPSSAAAFSSARVEMPRASCTALIFGRLSTGASSSTPAGSRDFSFSSCALRPVVAISVMVDASAAPIPGTSVSRPVARQHGDVLAQHLDRARPALVGLHLERVRAVHLQQERDLPQRPRDLELVGHGRLMRRVRSGGGWPAAAGGPMGGKPDLGRLAVHRLHEVVRCAAAGGR